MITPIALKKSSDSSERILILLFLWSSHKFSRYRGQLPISRPHWFYQGHLGQETGLLSTRLKVTKADP